MYEQMRPLQLKQLEILKTVIDICEKHNIRYFVAFGTLLGTIRHNGFIPWDNDIDLLMPIIDYEKFQTVCESELKYPYFLQNRKTDPGCHETFTKVRLSNTTFIEEKNVDYDMNHGICIDIYPLAKISDNRFVRKVDFIKGNLYLLLLADIKPKNHGRLFSFIASLLLSIFSEKRKNKVIDRLWRKLTKYENMSTKNVIQLSCNPEALKRYYDSSIFDGFEYKQFESLTIRVPTGWDTFLKDRYGDYMTPPDKKEIDTRQEYIKLDCEKAYQEYKGQYYCVNKI